MSNEKSNLKRDKLVKSTAVSAMMIMFSMVISRILGFVRDILISHQFGQGIYTDAYNLAFTLPDLIYMLLVGGAFSAAFVPNFSAYVARGEEDEAWEVASITLNVVCVSMLVLLTLAYVFTPQLVTALVKIKEYDPLSLIIAIKLTRIMLLQVVFMALAGICSGILQSYKIFGPTAYGGVIYNLGIIGVGALCSGVIESHFPGYGIAAFTLGVVVGALGNFLIQALSLRKVGIQYHFTLDVKNPGFQKIAFLMVPVLLGLSANEISLIINQKLASGLGEGLLSAWKMASRFMQLPISIFAISIAITLFPVLSHAAAKKELTKFRQDYSQGLRTIFFLCIPCSVLLAVLGVPVIRLLFESGKFTPENTANTAYALSFFVIGVFAQGGIHLSSRAFYALHNTKAPVLTAVCGIIVNIICSVLLVQVLSHGGLALGYSIGGIVNLVLIMLLLKRRLRHFHGRQIAKSFGLTLCASAVMGIFAYLCAWGFEITLGTAGKLAQLGQVSFSCLVAFGIFMLTAKLLKMSEAEVAINMVKKRLFKTKTS